MHRLAGIKNELVELTEADAAAVVELRNDPVMNRFLSNSGQTLTVEHQLNWMRMVKEEGDNINFKIVYMPDRFSGTISLYDIHEGEAEFGRYMATNAISALESEYLILKFGFEVLGLKRIYCKTVKKNTKVWQQHFRFGFKQTGEDVDHRIGEERVIQSITADEYRSFDYSPILSLIQKF